LSAPEACCLNVLVQDLLEQVMYGHFVLFAAFFMEPESTACAIVIIIIDFEFQYGAHTGEAAAIDMAAWDVSPFCFCSFFERELAGLRARSLSQGKSSGRIAGAGRLK
jgi:hypothetical protein